MAYNRELSQFSSFVEIDDSSKNISIASSASQNVGIGLTNPTSKLQVTGDVNISGATTTVRFTATNASAIYLSGISLNYSGISTFSSLVVSGLATVGNLYISGISSFNDQVDIFSGVSVTGVITAPTFDGNATTASYTPLSGVSTYSEASGIATYSDIAGIATYSSLSGVSTYSEASGIATYSSLSGVSTYSEASGIATYSSISGVSTDVVGGIGSVSQLIVSGVSTFTSGPVFISTDTSTGTSGQLIQIDSGAYISGSVGVGTTNPESKLSVVGGDISVGIDTSNGLILTSPNGTKYRLIVDDSGNLTTTAI